MENQESQGFAEVLATRVGEDADAAQIAGALLTIWVEIDRVLAPIIGERGVALLYKRSIYLTMQSHPWLSHTHEGAETAMHLEGLEAAFAQQSNSDAAAAGHALLLKFHQLLASLIGPSLTQRLLRSVLAPLESGQPVQDMTP